MRVGKKTYFISQRPMPGSGATLALLLGQSSLWSGVHCSVIGHLISKRVKIVKTVLQNAARVEPTTENRKVLSCQSNTYDVFVAITIGIQQCLWR